MPQGSRVKQIVESTSGGSEEMLDVPAPGGGLLQVRPKRHLTLCSPRWGQPPGQVRLIDIAEHASGHGPAWG